MKKNDELSYRLYTAKAENDKAINSLKGILQGINLDREVNVAELRELDNWAAKYSSLIHREPFQEFISIIRETLRSDLPKVEAIEDMYWLCQKYEVGNEYYNAVTAELQELQGICYGVLADGVIRDQEIIELEKWIDSNKHLSSYYPYDELRTVLFKILKDGVVDHEEKILLKAYFSQFVKLTNEELTTKIDQEIKATNISGLCAFEPNITIDGKLFSCTGKLSRGSRGDLAKLIANLGGVFSDNITKKTNYLIVGDNGNPAWAFACYGRKVERALKMRKEGDNILIVHENDFLDFTDDLQ